MTLQQCRRRPRRGAPSPAASPTTAPAARAAVEGAHFEGPAAERARADARAQRARATGIAADLRALAAALTRDAEELAPPSSAASASARRRPPRARPRRRRSSARRVPPAPRDADRDRAGRAAAGGVRRCATSPPSTGARRRGSPRTGCRACRRSSSRATRRACAGSPPTLDALAGDLAAVRREPGHAGAARRGQPGQGGDDRTHGRADPRAAGAAAGSNAADPERRACRRAAGAPRGC